MLCAHRGCRGSSANCLSGMGPCHYAASCQDELLSLKMLQLLLSQGSNIPEYSDASGSLCIHHVAKVGSVLVMKYLLTQAGCNVLVPDALGNSVLHISLENRHPLMSEFLAEWDKRLLSIKNHQKQVPLFNLASGETRLPFHNASASRIALNLAVVADFDRKDGTPSDAFDACLTRGDVLGVERLLKEGFNARQWAHKDGGTALHAAVTLQGLVASEMIDVIMLHGAVDIDSTDSAGHTALDIADSLTHKVAMKQLVKWGAQLKGVSHSGSTIKSKVSKLDSDTTGSFDEKDPASYGSESREDRELLTSVLRHPSLSSPSPYSTQKTVEASQPVDFVIEPVIEVVSKDQILLEKLQNAIEDATPNTGLLSSICTTLMFSSGSSINSLLPNGNTAIGHAIKLGRDDLVPILIDAGASVRTPDRNGMTAIHQAISARSPIITLQNLMRQEPGCETDHDPFGRPPLLLSLENGNADAAIFIAKTYPRCCRAVVEGNTMLHYCLIFRCHNLVTHAVASGYLPALHLRDFNGQTPLQKHLESRLSSRQLAAANKPAGDAIAATLSRLQLFAVPDEFCEVIQVIQMAACEDDRVIFSAVATNNIPKMESLLEAKANINIRSIRGRTPLQVSVTEGFDSLALLLLEHGASSLVQDDDNRTSLHLAALKGHTSILTSLIQHLPSESNLDVEDICGMTPLHCAVLSCHLQCVVVLLEFGACVSAVSAAGLSCLHLATCHDAFEVAQHILSIQPRLIFALDPYLQTPLHAAASLGALRCLSLYLVEHDKLTSADLEVQDACKGDVSGNSPLHLAAQFGKSECVLEILQFRIDLGGMKNNDGLSPSAVARECNFSDIADQIDSTTRLLVSDAHKKSSVSNDAASPTVSSKVLDDFLESEPDTVNLIDETSTKLHAAVHNGEEDAVRKLLASGVPQSIDGRLYTPLHVAVLSQKANIVKILLESEASTDVYDSFGCTPLHYAAAQGSADMLQLLAGCDPQVLAAEVGAASAAFGHGWNVVHIASSAGYVDVIEIALQMNNSLVHLLDASGSSPLHVACYHGHARAVNCLLVNGFNPGIINSDGESPLQVANRKGFTNIPPIFATARGDLHVACANGDLNLVTKLLDDGADVNDKNSMGVTPLHASAFAANLKLAQLLISRGADQMQGDESEMAPIHYAAAEGAIDLVRFFVECAGKSVAGLIGAEGITPAHMAANIGHAEVLSYIAEVCGAEYCAQLDCKGNSPLHLASSWGHTACVNVLLQIGCSANVRNSKNMTPLMVALKENNVNGTLAAVRLLLPFTEIQETDDVVIPPKVYNDDYYTSSSADGISILHTLVSQGAVEELEKQLKLERSPDVVVSENVTPLHAAVLCGSISAVRVLLFAGAKLDTYDDMGFTPFHYACSKGSLVMVSLMLRFGDVDILEASLLKPGTTSPLICAIAANSSSVVQFLVNKFPSWLEVRNSDDVVPVAVALNNGCSLAVLRALVVGGADLKAIAKSLQSVNGTITDPASTRRIISVHEYASQFQTEASQFVQIVGSDPSVRQLPWWGELAEHVGVWHGRGCPLVHQASFLGRMYELRELLKGRTLVDEHDAAGFTALHAACAGGWLCVVDLLLKANYTVDASDNQVGLSPLFFAVNGGFPIIVERLLPLVSNASTLYDAQERSLLCYLPVDEDDAIAISTMILSVFPFISGVVTNPNVAEHIELVRTRVLSAASAISNKDHVFLSDLLLDLPLLVHCRMNSEGLTLLHMACEQSEAMPCVELLCNHGAATEAVMSNGSSPLHVAASSKSLAAMSLLLSHGASADLPDENGLTPLHIAAIESHSDGIELLVKAWHADACLNSSVGGSPLHTAVVTCNPNAVKILVESNPSPVHVRDIEGRTPLHSLVLRCKERLTLVQSHALRTIAACLLDNGASPFIPDADGISPAMMAQGSTAHGCAVVLAAAQQCKALTTALSEFSSDDTLWKRLLTVAGDGWASVCGVDVNGNTALHLSAYKNLDGLCALAVRRGSLLNARDLSGRTPLMISIMCASLQVTEILVQAGADVNCCDITGQTALHIALNNGDESSVSVLLKSRICRSDIPDQNANSALQLCISRHLESCLIPLIKLSIFDPNHIDASKFSICEYLASSQFSAAIISEALDLLLAAGFTFARFPEGATEVLVRSRSNSPTRPVSDDSSPGSRPMPISVSDIDDSLAAEAFLKGLSGKTKSGPTTSESTGVNVAQSLYAVEEVDNSAFEVEKVKKAEASAAAVLVARAVEASKSSFLVQDMLEKSQESDLSVRQGDFEHSLANSAMWQAQVDLKESQLHSNQEYVAQVLEIKRPIGVQLQDSSGVVKSHHQMLRALPAVQTPMQFPFQVSVLDSPIAITVGIKGNFRTISEALDRARDGSVLIISEGVYPEALDISRDLCLKGVGPIGSVVIQHNYGTILKLRGENMRVDNLTFSCNGNPVDAAIVVSRGRSLIAGCFIKTAGQTAIDVFAASTCNLVDVVVSESGGDAIIYRDGAIGICEHIRVERAGKCGIVIQAGANPAFSMVNVTNCVAHGILVEAAMGTFVDCDISKCNLALVAVRLTGRPDFKRCNLHDGESFGLYCYSQGEGTFESLDIYSTSLAGICCESMGAPSCKACIVHDCGDAGLLVSQSGAGDFTRVNISSCKTDGIFVSSKGDPHMSQCSITNCSGYGAYIKDGGLGCFRGCEFSQHELSNVCVESNGNPLFDACRIHDNAGGHNVLFGMKAKGQMMDCHIFQGVNECIMMKSCTGSIMRACNISKTKVGVCGVDDARAEMYDCTIADVEEACASFGFRADVSLERCKTHSSSKYGMIFTEGAICKLIDCSIYNCAQYGIMISNSGNPLLRNARIFNCKVGGVLVDADGAGTFDICDIYECRPVGISISRSGNALFKKCRIHGCNGDGVLVSMSGLGIFDGCSVYSNTKAGFAVESSGAPILKNGCRIFAGLGVGMLFTHGGAGKVDGCIVTDNARDGIAICGLACPSIWNTRIIDGQGVGLHIFDSGKGELINCDISANKGGGVLFERGADTAIRSCNIYDCALGGVLFSQGSMGSLSLCNFYNNSSYSVKVQRDGNPLISACKFYDLTAPAIESVLSARGKVERCNFKSVQICALVSDESVTTFETCTFEDGCSTAFLFHDKGSGSVVDCAMFNCSSDAIQVSEGSMPQISRCTIDGAQGAGICYSGGSGGSLTSCIIKACKGPCVVVQSLADPTFTENTFHGSHDSGVLVLEEGKGNFHQNNIFGNVMAGVSVCTGGNPAFGSNSISGNSSHGIYIYNAGLGSFTGTSIVENELCGVMCDTQGCATLVGCNIDRNKQSAIAVADDGDAIATKCSMSDNSEVSVFIGAGSNPTLKQCSISKSRGVGVLVRDSGKGVFEDCTIERSMLSGIVISHRGDPKFQQCCISDGDDAGVLVTDNGLGSFIGCDIFGNTMPNVSVRGDSNPSFLTCRINNGQDSGLLVYNRGRGMFERCSFTGNFKANVAVETQGCPFVQDCLIQGGKDAGVIVYDSGGGTFQKCEVANTSGDGIIVESSADPHIKGCNIHNSLSRGVYYREGGSGLLEQNEIYENSMAGVAIATGSNPIIRKNIIRDGLASGIYVCDGGRGIFEDNNTYGNMLDFVSEGALQAKPATSGSHGQVTWDSLSV
jgi:F-box protein 11